MLEIENRLNGLPVELTLRFFVTFARFEFALKHCGCLQRQRNGEAALACRRRLEARLPKDFFERLQRNGNAEALILRPPKNLVVGHHPALRFDEEPAALLTTMDVLNATWRVRNNLFHGNKMYPANGARDAELMKGALTVIEPVLEVDHGIAVAFHEPQQFF